MLVFALLACEHRCADYCATMGKKPTQNVSAALELHVDFVKSLQALLIGLPTVGEFTSADDRTLKTLRERVSTASETLREYVARLDRTAEPSDTFHPGSYRRVAELIVGALTAEPLIPLGAITPYYGAGIYALYYTGNHPAYALISGTSIPIYAGAASPISFRAITPRDQGTALFVRQSEHAKSIRAAQSYDLVAAGRLPEEGLRLEDFVCRRLVVETGWEVAAESYLIKYYQPLWNKETKVCQGLGKHGDSSKVRGNSRSHWDTLHPGRGWATADDNKPGMLTPRQITHEIWKHCIRTYSLSEMNTEQLQSIREELALAVATERPKRRARARATPEE